MKAYRWRGSKAPGIHCRLSSRVELSASRPGIFTSRRRVSEEAGWGLGVVAKRKIPVCTRNRAAVVWSIATPSGYYRIPRRINAASRSKYL
jgi:hypothetical protein